MMINALTGQAIAAEDLYQEASDLQAKLADVPAKDLVMRVNQIQRIHGQALALSRIESEFSSIETWGREQEDWTPERVLLTKFNVLSRLALSSPDDTWSGRDNDARRTESDGAREILQDVLQDLRTQEFRLYRKDDEDE